MGTAIVDEIRGPCLPASVVEDEGLGGEAVLAAPLQPVSATAPAMRRTDRNLIFKISPLIFEFVMHSLFFADPAEIACPSVPLLSTDPLPGHVSGP